MPWSCIEFSNRDVAADRPSGVLLDFAQALLANLSPEAAVFDRATPEGGTTYYFTPAASQVFRQGLAALGALECDPPTGEGLDLLAGEPDLAWPQLPTSQEAHGRR